MADQAIPTENRRKPNVFGMIKDIAVVAGLFITMAVVFGFFGEVKTDIAVIKTKIVYMEKALDSHTATPAVRP